MGTIILSELMNRNTHEHWLKTFQIMVRTVQGVQINLPESQNFHRSILDKLKSTCKGLSILDIDIFVLHERSLEFVHEVKTALAENGLDCAPTNDLSTTINSATATDFYTLKPR